MMDLVNVVLPSNLIYTIIVIVCIYFIRKLTNTFIKHRGRYLNVRDALKAFPGPERHWLYGNLHLVSE